MQPNILHILKKIIAWIQSHMIAQIIVVVSSGILFITFLYRLHYFQYLLIMHCLISVILIAIFYGWVSVIKELHQQIIHIHYGNAGHALPNRRRDEIGRLADTLEQIRLKHRDTQNRHKQTCAERKLTLACQIHDLQGLMLNASIHMRLSCEHIEESEIAVTHGQSAIRRLKDAQAWISQISSESMTESRAPLKPALIELNAFLTQLVNDFGAMDLERQMPLRFIPLAGRCDIHADPHYLSRIMGNLLSNALKYGAAGHPVIVEMTRSPLWLSIRVKNHSRPIPKEELRHLFEPFYTISASPPGASALSGFNCSGLGLFIAKELSESLHGTLLVDNNGKETCFTLRLPLNEPHSEQAATGHGPI